jgi:hypothetical protein
LCVCVCVLPELAEWGGSCRETTLFELGAVVGDEGGGIAFVAELCGRVQTTRQSDAEHVYVLCRTASRAPDK